jgi:hypothetical protein
MTTSSAKASSAELAGGAASNRWRNSCNLFALEGTGLSYQSINSNAPARFSRTISRPLFDHGFVRG